MIDDEEEIEDDVNMYRQFDNDQPERVTEETEIPENKMDDKKRGFIYPLKVAKQ